MMPGCALGCSLAPFLRGEGWGEGLSPHEHSQSDSRKTLIPLHCERSEAIQNPSAETVWIAPLRSQ
jgi:hypothetical protein